MGCKCGACYAPEGIYNVWVTDGTVWFYPQPHESVSLPRQPAPYNIIASDLLVTHGASTNFCICIVSIFVECVFEYHISNPLSTARFKRFKILYMCIAPFKLYLSMLSCFCIVVSEKITPYWVGTQCVNLVSKSASTTRLMWVLSIVLCTIVVCIYDETDVVLMSSILCTIIVYMSWDWIVNIAAFLSKKLKVK